MVGVQVRPISPSALTSALVTRIIALGPQRRVRVAIDGAPAAGPEIIAAALVTELRELGRPAEHVRTEDYLRPASLRLEFGRSNPDSYYDGWTDLQALRREVLDPLEPGGSGRILPTFWDPIKDRNTRSGYLAIPPGGVVVLSGPLLLGAGLTFDLEVHLEMSGAALARRTPADQAWTLPAFERYAEEVAPAAWAQIVVRVNDPAHPALVEP
jgi:hypothetical protein